LFVKVLVDDPPKLVTLEEHPSTTVLSLLKKLECCEPTSNLALLYNGIFLTDGDHLSAEDCDRLTKISTIFHRWQSVYAPCQQGVLVWYSGKATASRHKRQ
jgi:hypothetical protein